MSNYYNGTSAYKITDFAYTDYKNQDVQENIARRREVRESKKAEFVKHLRGAAIFFSVFAIAIGVLFTNAIIIEKSSQVNDMQNQLKAITAQNNQTTLDIERSLDLKRIEEIAINELGMKHPDKYQMVYVNVEQTNYAEISDKKGTTWNGGTLVAMGKGIGEMMEYID